MSRERATVPGKRLYLFTMVDGRRWTAVVADTMNLTLVKRVLNESIVSGYPILEWNVNGNGSRTAPILLNSSHVVSVKEVTDNGEVR